MNDTKVLRNCKIVQKSIVFVGWRNTLCIWFVPRIIVQVVISIDCNFTKLKKKNSYFRFACYIFCISFLVYNTSINTSYKNCLLFKQVDYISVNLYEIEKKKRNTEVVSLVYFDSSLLYAYMPMSWKNVAEIASEIFRCTDCVLVIRSYCLWVTRLVGKE